MQIESTVQEPPNRTGTLMGLTLTEVPWADEVRREFSTFGPDATFETLFGSAYLSIPT